MCCKEQLEGSFCYHVEDMDKIIRKLLRRIFRNHASRREYISLFQFPDILFCTILKDVLLPYQHLKSFKWVKTHLLLVFPLPVIIYYNGKIP